MFALRLTKNGPTVEDITQSYQTLRYFDGQEDAGRVPYVVVNDHEALDTLHSVIGKGKEILRYGYEHPVGATVTSPYTKVFMIAFCIVRKGSGFRQE